MRWSGLSNASEKIQRSAAWLSKRGVGVAERFKAWFSGLRQDERDAVICAPSAADCSSPG